MSKEHLEDIEYSQCYNCGSGQEHFRVDRYRTADPIGKNETERYMCMNCGAHYVKHYERSWENPRKLLVKTEKK